MKSVYLLTQFDPHNQTAQTMARSTLLPLLSLLALQAIAQTPIAAEDQIVSQISDGQVQALPSVSPAPLDSTLTEEATSTTSETSTTSATISLPLLPALNSSAVVAPAIPSTSATPVPTSILVAAPAGAPGAASNYTGLETVEGSASYPTPRVPIPVPLNTNATAVVPTTSAAALNTTSSAVATSVAPTTASEGEEASTTTEAPVAATGAGVRLYHASFCKEMVAAGMLVWAVGVI